MQTESITVPSVGEIWASAELIQSTKDGIEIWHPVLGAEGLYEVSNFGQVRNANTGALLAQMTFDLGYKSVGLYLGGKKRRCATVQFLMAEAFIGPRPGTRYEWESAHHDGSKDNNRLDNIAWKTRKANQADRRRHGTMDVREHRVIDGKKCYRCTICGEWKPETEFKEHNAGRSVCKRSSACVECGRVKGREHKRKARQQKKAA